MARLLLLLLAIFVLETGCDVDVFNSDCRKVGLSGYWLCREDSGPTVYYLERVGKAASGGGVLDGVVRTIGWNNEVIVARRYATYRGDADGLMVVNVAARSVECPIESGTISKRYPKLKQLSASKAWAVSR